MSTRKQLRIENSLGLFKVVCPILKYFDLIANLHDRNPVFQIQSCQNISGNGTTGFETLTFVDFNADVQEENNIGRNVPYTPDLLTHAIFHYEEVISC